MVKVVHKKDNCSNAVYIGRPSKFGNPFSIGIDGNRTQVIQQYKEYFYANEELQKAAIAELTGHDLECWCAPLACHGDVIKEFLDAQ